MEDRKYEAICRLLEVTGVPGLFVDLVDGLVEGERISHPELDEDFWRGLRDSIRYEDFLGDLAYIYDRNYTLDDVLRLTEFFVSNVGRKYLETSKDVTVRIMVLEKRLSERIRVMVQEKRP